MTDRNEAQRIAAQIAEDLFVNGMGEVADRLVLTSKEGRDLGGWGRLAVVDRIADGILRARAQENLGAPRGTSEGS